MGLTKTDGFSKTQLEVAAFADVFATLEPEDGRRGRYQLKLGEANPLTGALKFEVPDADGGKAITVYGQNEVVRDLIDARIAETAAAVAYLEQGRARGKVIVTVD